MVLYNFNFSLCKQFFFSKYITSSVREVSASTFLALPRVLELDISFTLYIQVLARMVRGSTLVDIAFCFCVKCCVAHRLSSEIRVRYYIDNPWYKVNNRLVSGSNR